MKVRSSESFNDLITKGFSRIDGRWVRIVAIDVTFNNRPPEIRPGNAKELILKAWSERRK
jgi:hypothetical protein